MGGKASLRDAQLRILISPRLSTVRMADRILVIKNGQLLGIGSPEDLRALGGRYAECLALLAAGYR